MSSSFKYRPLVLAMLALQGSTALAQEEPAAAPAGDAQAPVALPATTVKAQAEAPYKADTVSSPKFTQALVDTPQTITVIKKEILQEQGAVSLMEALRNTPGITMQMGENGNSSQGDTFQMRGFSTQTSTFVDGVRDLGAVTRDTFNLEAVEVVKGPAGADIGRGATSGYINLVSKVPSLKDTSSLSWMIGSAEKNRLSADVNRKVGDTTAVRLNVMQQQSGVDGRDFVENNSVGIAPSIAFGIGTTRRVYLYAQHLEQDNVPDGGIPTIGMEGHYANPVYNHDNASATPTVTTPEGNALAAAYQGGARVNRNNYYGSAWDYERVTADMLTARVEWDLAPGLVLTNTSRYGRTDWQRLVTGVNGPSLSRDSVGTYADPVALTGFTPGTNNPANPNTWTANRSVQGTDQENGILANVTNLLTSFETGGLQHDLSTGIEFARESQRNNTVDAAPTVPAANLYNPNPFAAFVFPKFDGWADGDTTTLAIYAFDTLSIGDNLKLSAGLRFEHYETESEIFDPTPTAPAPALLKLEDSDNLLGWKLGALYKPAPNGSIYAAVATSQLPPGSANFSLNSTASSASNSVYDPQEATNIELGTKWDVLGQRLALTAAVYQTDNENEVTYEPLTASYSQDGKTRVKGVEFGAAGQVTRAWQVSAGIAFMDAEALEAKSFSTTNGLTNNDGGAVRWTPEVSATLWSTYRVTSALTVGGGARYVGEQQRVITPGANPATQNMPKIPDYVVIDAMASYKLGKDITVRGNVYNLLDEEYISVLNNGGSRMTLGAPLSASVTLDFQF